jgi:putative inorganic carbon (hco3(-)) transporter
MNADPRNLSAGTEQQERFARSAALAIASLIAVFVVGSISFLGAWAPLHWHDVQRIGQVSLLVLCWLLILVACRSVRLAVPLQAPALLGAVAFVLGAVSAVQAVAPRFAFAEWGLLLLLVWLAWLVSRVHTRLGNIADPLALAMIAAAAGVLVAPFVSGYLAGTWGGLGLRAEFLIAYGFSNPRFFGQFHVFALPLLAAALLACRERSVPRAVVWVLLVATWVIAIATGTRSTWFALGAGAVVVAAVAWAPLLRLASVHARALPIALGASYLLFAWLPWYLGLETAQGVLGGFVGRFADPLALSMRDVLWTRALDVITAHPWLGVGPMMLALDYNPVGAHPHNAALQLAAEWGVPALLLIAAAAAIVWIRLALVLRRMARAQPAEQKTVIACALVLALSASGVQSMVDGVIVMPYAQVMAATVLGWAWSVLPWHDDGRSAHGLALRLPAPVAAGLLALPLAAVLYAVLPEALRLEQREQAFQRAHPHSGSLKPRLWSQGWLIDDVRADWAATLDPIPVPAPATLTR